VVERGFTLIELSVALTVLAIVAAMAWGQYRGYWIRARQAETKIQLLALLHQVEQLNDPSLTTAYHTDHYRFYARRTEEGQVGLAIWLVQAEPQGSMVGTGGLGLDSRGYSCFTPAQDSPCVPLPRGSWN